MKARKMKRLALAVTAAIGGMGALTSAHAVNLSQDGLGDVLLFPYYTVRGGWNTLFSVTNTSDYAVAVKVRFHEAVNSRDVFDFNVVMSPHDVWTAWVTDSANGPVLHTDDNSCTVPAIRSTGQPFQGDGGNGILAYTGTPAADGGPATADRLREGYVEMIEMGASESGTVYQGALHDPNTGMPNDCAAVEQAFVPTPLSSWQSTLTSLQNQFFQPINALKGSFNLVNPVRGIQVGGSPTTLSNFFNSNPDEGSEAEESLHDMASTVLLGRATICSRCRCRRISRPHCRNTRRSTSRR